MKCSLRSVSSRQAGFTLIELLVVIAIIAILASVTIVGVSSAINAAKRTKGANTANQIQTAILAYYTEYGVYPVPPSSSGDKYYSDNDTSQQGLMYALCGNINASTGAQGTSSTSDVTNTRQIAFMTPKRSDVDANDGILINPFFTTTTATAANNPYFYIAMDSDYSGITGDSSPAQGTLPDFSAWTIGSTKGSHVLSNGTTQGAAVWADCDNKNLPPNEANSTSPQFWVHTY